MEKQKFEVQIKRFDKIASWISLFWFSFICIATKEIIWIGFATFFYMPIVDWLLLLFMKDIQLFDKILTVRAKIFKKINVFDTKYIVIKILIIFMISFLMNTFKNIFVTLVIAILFGIAHSIACNYVKVEEISEE